MRKKIAGLFFYILLVSSTSLIAQNTNWEVVSSNIKFKIKNAGINVDGTFSGLTSTISFDENKKNGNSIEAAIDVKTINTNNNSRDGHLKKADYFNVTSFPTITMKSNQFVKDKTGNWIGLFKLTIKGITKDVYVPFSVSYKDDFAIFKATFSINRLDYNVGTSSMILSDKATVYIEVKTKKQ